MKNKALPNFVKKMIRKHCSLYLKLSIMIRHFSSRYTFYSFASFSIFSNFNITMKFHLQLNCFKLLFGYYSFVMLLIINIDYYTDILPFYIPVKNNFNNFFLFNINDKYSIFIFFIIVTCSQVL